MTIEDPMIRSTFEPKDYLIPGILFGAGITIYMLYGLIVGGVSGMVAMAIAIPIQTAVQVALGIVACFITARLMGASFGYLKTAIVKLAAIFVFPSAATFFIPYVGWLIALLLYWRLLEWLFELDGMETIALAVVIWGVNMGALLLVATMGIAMAH